MFRQIPFTIYTIKMKFSRNENLRKKLNYLPRLEIPKNKHKFTYKVAFDLKWYIYAASIIKPVTYLEWAKIDSNQQLAQFIMKTKIVINVHRTLSIILKYILTHKMNIWQKFMQQQLVIEKNPFPQDRGVMAEKSVSPCPFEVQELQPKQENYWRNMVKNKKKPEESKTE